MSHIFRFNKEILFILLFVLFYVKVGVYNYSDPIHQKKGKWTDPYTLYDKEQPKKEPGFCKIEKITLS